MLPTFTSLLYSKKNGIATISFNRPNVRNALNVTLTQEIVTAFNIAEKEDDVLVVILTGVGQGFSSGADLASNTISSGKSVYDALANGHWATMIETIQKFPKPIIAAINGAAAGAGSSVAMACDLKIMEEDSYILLAFINIGLVPDVGACYQLVQTVGYTLASEIALSGKPVPASKCLELGLVNKVVPKGKLLEEAQKYAEFIASKPPFAARLTKEILRFSRNKTLPEVIEYEARMQQLCIDSPDFLEGRNAFLEKRKPKWTGKSIDVPRGFFAKL